MEVSDLVKKVKFYAGLIEEVCLRVGAIPYHALPHLRVMYPTLIVKVRLNNHVLGFLP